MTGHGDGHGTRQPKNLSWGAAIWFNECYRLSPRRAIYSRVMNEWTSAKTTPNVILACQPIIMLSGSDTAAATTATADN